MSFSETLGDLDNDNQIERESNHLAELASLRAQLEQANERIDWLQQQRQVESEQKEAALSDSDRFMRENSDLRAQLDTARQEIEKLELMAGDSTKFGMELINERDSLRGLVDEMAPHIERLRRTIIERHASALAVGASIVTPYDDMLEKHTALKAGRV